MVHNATAIRSLRVLAARVETVPTGRLLQHVVISSRHRVRPLLVHVSCTGCRIVRLMGAIMLMMILLLLLDGVLLADVNDLLQVIVELFFVASRDSLD